LTLTIFYSINSHKAGLRRGAFTPTRIKNPRFQPKILSQRLRMTNIDLTVSTSSFQAFIRQKEHDKLSWMIRSIVGAHAESHAEFLRREFPHRTSRNLLVEEVPGETRKVELVCWEGVFLPLPDNPESQKFWDRFLHVEEERMVPFVGRVVNIGRRVSFPRRPTGPTIASVFARF
jgi:hypothetical protein